MSSANKEKSYKNKIITPFWKHQNRLKVFFLPFLLGPGVFFLQTNIGSVPTRTIPQFQWPIQKGVYPDLKGITSTFCESRTDHFHNGVDISSLNEPVKPVAKGKILYSRLESDDPWNETPGPGNYIMVNHGSGWISGYYHLKEKESIKRYGEVDHNSVMAKTGNTGHSVGAHLHFIIADKYGKRIQNPLQFLPKTTDPNEPIIGQIILKTSKGETRINHSKPENIRMSQSWPFYITIIDPGLEKGSRRGIYKLVWSLNNQKPQERNYTFLEMNDEEWLLENKYSFQSSFYLNYYNLGNMGVSNGKNTIRVRATDFSGNSTEVTFEIHIDKVF